MDVEAAKAILSLNSSGPKKVPRPIPCYACRSMRKKCSLEKPSCTRCIQRGTPCSYATSRKPYTKKAKVPPETAALSNISKVTNQLNNTPAPQADASPLSPSSCSHSESSHDHQQQQQQLQVYDSSSSTSSTTASTTTASATSSTLPIPSQYGYSNYHVEIAALTKRPLVCHCCKTNKRKCDRMRPSCTSCLELGQDCEYVLSAQKASQEKWRVRLELENLAALAGVPVAQLPSGFAIKTESEAPLTVTVPRNSVMSVNYLLD
ncbi:hypothetical protein BDR26DRAFT_916824 [Obelidium mucronatum]|nr:hypothetical protein BDR26DRAFT_916824 [Obelidium mucronatum]